MEDLAILQACSCVYLHATFPASQGCVLPRSTLSPGPSPGLSLEGCQGGLGGLMCRHSLCERRSKTRQELVPGPQPPRAAPVSAVRGARESCEPYPRLAGCAAGHWLQSTVIQDGSSTAWLYFLVHRILHVKNASIRAPK